MSNEQVVWVPLADGNYDGIGVASNGEMLTIGIWDELGQREEIGTWLPKDIRLCRATTVPAAASVPSEISSIIGVWRNHFAIRAHELLSQNPKDVNGLHFWMEVQVMDAWLSSLTQEGDSGTPN